MSRYYLEECKALEAQGIRESQRVQIPLLEFYGRTEAKVKEEFETWKMNYTIKIGLITSISMFLGEVVSLVLYDLGR